MTTERKPRPKAAAPADYYGFAPEQTYLLRSRVRAYSGTTERFVFANGSAIAYPMRLVDDASGPAATDEQKWARGERLGRLSSDRTYRVYVYGQEPAANAEPLWRNQPDPSAATEGEDLGEDTHLWQPVPDTSKPPVQMPVEGPTPSGRTSNELREALPKADQDTGERRPPRASRPTTPPAPPAWDRAPGATEPAGAAPEA